MVESRWFRRLGPGIAALGAVVVIASTTLGAAAVRLGRRRPARRPVSRGRRRRSARGIRLDPVARSTGVGAASGSTLGRAGDGGDRGGSICDPESFAAGPVRRRRPGRHGRWRDVERCAVDVGAGCRLARRTVAATSSAEATLEPGSARRILEHRVDRATRADLGVWRRPLDGAMRRARRSPPIDARSTAFGRTWLDGARRGATTVGRWSSVVRRGRLPRRARRSATGAAPDRRATRRSVASSGSRRTRLVAMAACRGLPCPLLSVDVGTGRTTVLDARGRSSRARRVTRRADRSSIHELGTDGRADPGRSAPTGRERDVTSTSTGPDRLRGGPGLVRRRRRARTPAGSPFGPDGRLPIAGDAPAIAPPRLGRPHRPARGDASDDRAWQRGDASAASRW